MIDILFRRLYDRKLLIHSCTLLEVLHPAPHPGVGVGGKQEITKVIRLCKINGKRWRYAHLPEN